MMTLIHCSFLVLMANLYSQVLGHSSYGCGEPGVDVLTNFTLTGSASLVGSDPKPKHFKNGTTIEYQCRYKNDKLMDNQTTRVCADGRWTPRMPRCGRYINLTSILVNPNYAPLVAKNLNNAVFAKYMQLFDERLNRFVNGSRVKLYDALDIRTKTYLAGSWPEECKKVRITDTGTQSLVIALNSSLFFNFISLSLVYPPFYTTMVNYTDVVLQLLISSQPTKMHCEILKQNVTNNNNVYKGPLIVNIFIKCKVDEDLYKNNKSKDNVENDFQTEQIKLKFQLNKKNKMKYFEVGVCEIELFRYPPNDCGTPDIPRHSRNSSNEDFTQFTCEEGFDLSPKTMSGYLMTCGVNGEFDKEFPVCEAKSFCAPIPNVGKGWPIISYINANFVLINGTNMTTVNTIASHSCHNVTVDGYETILRPETQPFRTCEAGEWSATEFKCVPNLWWRRILASNLIYISIFTFILVLLVLILIIILVIFLRSKRTQQKEIPQMDRDSIAYHNYYESVRMSNVSNQNYDYFYPSADQTDPSLNTNSIYEVTEGETPDLKSDIMWSPNSTYG